MLKGLLRFIIGMQSVVNTHYFVFSAVLLVQAPEEGPCDGAVIVLVLRLHTGQAPLQDCGL